MLYYLIAGEASGDMHGANLMLAIKKFDPKATFRIWGGDRMQKEGGILVRHYRELAFMGFVDVVKNLPTILKNIKHCKADIIATEPDAVIFIDYPGFNMRIANWLKKSSLRSKSIYYISPQVWAWKAGRANKLRDMLDKMLVILPFEKQFYKKYNFEVTYVGHPLLDELQSRVPDPEFRTRNRLSGDPIIAVLPGSRRQEIKVLLGPMLSLAKKYPHFQFVIAGLSNLPDEIYQFDASTSNNIKLIKNETHQLLAESHSALVASGTATLETALYGVPLIVCYKGSIINYIIAKNLIDIKYISLVNLILDQPLVPELIQDKFNAENLEKTLQLILQSEERERIAIGYQALRKLLEGSSASQTAASIIYKLCNSEQKSD